MLAQFLAGNDGHGIGRSDFNTRRNDGNNGQGNNGHGNAPTTAASFHAAVLEVYTRAQERSGYGNGRGNAYGVRGNGVSTSV
ncbi:hypothetical protein [Azospirillum sp.]|uniref:hypothetical protein n=1 Tax=Azospirillum sp. TaxID=34012 RepID=UPI003D703221